MADDYKSKDFGLQSNADLFNSDNRFVKFLLHESSEHRLAAFLQEQGHDVKSIAHDYPNALSDTEVLELAGRDARILITNDKDFGELVFKRGLRHHGVILLRLPYGDTAHKLEAIRVALLSHADDLGDFVVLESRGVRVRRTPKKA